jgi:1-acyl-sn-glycerol-3-phosphate acyltransferase
MLEAWGDFLMTHSRPSRSPRLFGLFRRYAKRYVSRHFHAVRVSKGGPVPDLPRRPLIVVVNHPSWWDPLIGLVLSESMPAWRVHFAPIASQGMAQYRFLERVGFFGIDTGTTRGGLTFLRTSLAILAQPEAALWITAQGEFVDPRERPIGLKPGIGHLVHRSKGVLIVTLAIEYPFWNDRCPEVLTRFGPVIAVDSGRSLPPEEWTAIIAGALEAAQDRLAEESRRRDPDAFEIQLGGTAGVGGVYDIGRRLRAMLRGTRFQSEHAARPRSDFQRMTPSCSL